MSNSKHLHALGILFFTCLAEVALGQIPSDPTMEPPAILEVNLNGQTLRVLEGETIDVNGTPVTVTLAATRALQMGRVSFEYPRHFAYAYDGSSPGMRNWTVDGNDVVVMFFEMTQAISIKDFETEMVGRFGKKNCRPMDTEMKLGGRNWQGRRIEVTLVGTLIMVNLLNITLDDGITRFLIIQDTRVDSPETGDEVMELQRVLDRTISYD
jgi:hypothetical protein